MQQLKTIELVKIITQTLDDSKAQKITQLNIKPLTDIADVMIITTATSSRHAQAQADRVIAAVKAADIMPLGLEGYDLADWILIDVGDVLVNVMLAETRELYALEKLWSQPDEQS